MVVLILNIYYKCCDILYKILFFETMPAMLDQLLRQNLEDTIPKYAGSKGI